MIDTNSDANSQTTLDLQLVQQDNREFHAAPTNDQGVPLTAVQQLAQLGSGSSNPNSYLWPRQSLNKFKYDNFIKMTSSSGIELQGDSIVHITMFYDSIASKLKAAHLSSIDIIPKQTSCHLPSQSRTS